MCDPLIALYVYTHLQGGKEVQSLVEATSVILGYSSVAATNIQQTQFPTHLPPTTAVPSHIPACQKV